MKERKEQDEQWFKNKIENALHNRQILVGWKGGIFYENGWARKSLKDLIPKGSERWRGKRNH